MNARGYRRKTLFRITIVIIPDEPSQEQKAWRSERLGEPGGPPNSMDAVKGAMVIRKMAAGRAYVLAWVLAGLLALGSLLVVSCAADAPVTPAGSPTSAPQSTEPPADLPAYPTATLDQPTAIPMPEATSVATEAPTSTSEPPPTVAVPADRARLGDTAFGYASRLVEDIGSRASATDEELTAAEYLIAQFRAMGYAPVLQEFSVASLESSLEFRAPGSAVFDGVKTVALSHSATGVATASLEFVGLGRESDFDALDLEGKIALIERGEVSFQDKVARAAGAGVEAAIIFNNQPGRFRGTLRERSQIPALAVSQEDGAKIREAMSGGPVEASVALEQSAEQSRNVVVEKPGTGGGVVIVGGHYDTVPDVDGANDNASGTAAVLTLAKELADRSFPFTLRFIAFGSEETGLNGSKHYVSALTEDERGEIKAMINLDVVGTGEGIRITGDSWLTGHVSETADREGIAVGLRGGMRGGSSDHASFREAGIPVIFFFADDVSRIHTPEDTLKYIDPSLLGDTASLVLDLLDSMDSLPDHSG